MIVFRFIFVIPNPYMTRLSEKGDKNFLSGKMR